MGDHRRACGGSDRACAMPSPTRRRAPCACGEMPSTMIAPPRVCAHRSPATLPCHTRRATLFAAWLSHPPPLDWTKRLAGRVGNLCCSSDLSGSGQRCTRLLQLYSTDHTVRGLAAFVTERPTARRNTALAHRPGVATPTARLTGMMVTARVADFGRSSIGPRAKPPLSAPQAEKKSSPKAVLLDFE
jgi:hypothetical protein